MDPRLLAFAILALAACKAASDDTADTDTDADACGDVTTWDLVVVGAVADGSGTAVGGATVVLEDRGWEPVTELGSATTDGSGAFSLDADGVTSVDDCWGTLLDYVIVATDGSRTGEREVNASLHGAIADGTLEADISASPIVIE